MVYNKTHKLILRTIMNKGVMTFHEIDKTLCNYSYETNIVIKEMIHEINSQIIMFKQKIRHVYNESTGIDEAVFIQLGNDEIARSQTFFSPVDLEYFKKVLEEIVTSENKSINGILAVNVSLKVLGYNLSKVHAQSLLDMWCKQRYLKKSNEKYSLDSRSIHEFETYITERFSDCVESCFICKNNIYTGKFCIICKEYIHVHCLDAYLQKVKKWPCCKKEYVPQENSQLIIDGSLMESTLISSSDESDDDDYASSNVKNSKSSLRKRRLE